MLERALARIDERSLVGDRTAWHELPEVVRDEHRPLRMPTREREQRVERVADLALGPAKALLEVHRGRLGPQGVELDRDRVLEQRA